MPNDEHHTREFSGGVQVSDTITINTDEQQSRKNRRRTLKEFLNNPTPDLAETVRVVKLLIREN